MPVHHGGEIGKLQKHLHQKVEVKVQKVRLVRH